MIKPFISAIIVAYRSEKYINNCINSLRESANHAKIPLEVMVAINDENDKKYYLQNCKVIKNPINLGFAKAANLGAKSAVGELLLFLNPDTYTSKTAIQELLKHCKEYKTGVIIPKILNKNRSLQYNILCEPTLWDVFLEQSYLYKIFPKIFHHPQADKSLYLTPRSVEAASGSFIMIKKAPFKAAGGFDERFFMYYEDVDLCKRIKKLGYRIIYEPKAKIIHLLHKSSERGTAGNLYFKSLKTYLLKYHSILYTYIALIMIILGCLLRLFYWKIRILFIQDEDKTHFGENKIIYCKEVIYQFLF